MTQVPSSRPRVVLFAFVAVLALVALWLANGAGLGAPDAQAPAPPPGPGVPAGPVPANLTAPPAADTNTTEASADGREPVALPGTPTPPTAPRRGRVLDSRGVPLADVPLAWQPFEPSAGAVRAETAVVRSDAMGRFELAAPTAPSVPAAGPGWFTLRTTPWRPGDSRELLVVAAPATAIDGRTTRADDGTPLADVQVQADLLHLHDFPTPLDHTFVPMPTPARSDANGTYRLDHAPLAAGVELGFHHDGFTSVRQPSLAAQGGRLDVALTPANAVPGRLRGRVRDAQGPVAGASLQLGFDQQATSDANGAFTFELPGRPSRLLALRRGWQPIVRERVGADSPELDLVFERRTLTIEGTLRHADGTPAAGWRLDLTDPLRGYGFLPIEHESLSEPAPAECFAVTDAAGRFAVGGLAERSYTLLAYEPATLVSVTSAPIAAGTRDVMLTIPADACFETLRGTLVDRRGAPVPGASVSAWLAAASVEGAVSGPHTVTAADGTFALQQAPRRNVRLGVAKEGWLYAVQSIEQWTKDGADLRIVMSRLCAVRVEGEADLVVQFLDADGSLLHAATHSETMISSTNALRLHGGKSPVLSLPETTATMLWRRGDQEVGRKTVFLDPTPDAVTLLIAAK